MQFALPSSSVSQLRGNSLQFGRTFVDIVRDRLMITMLKKIPNHTGIKL
jgi:hypothetical protein